MGQRDRQGQPGKPGTRSDVRDGTRVAKLVESQRGEAVCDVDVDGLLGRNRRVRIGLTRPGVEQAPIGRRGLQRHPMSLQSLLELHSGERFT